MYNRQDWHFREGIWYSKPNVLQDNLVAVYGTLKKGYSNYHRHLSSAKFVGSGVTKDRYPLLIQGLPYMVEHKGIGYNVDVDVFKAVVDAWTTCKTLPAGNVSEPVVVKFAIFMFS